MYFIKKFKINKKVIIFLVLAGVLAAGYFFGRISGKIMLYNIVSGNSRASFLLYRPSSQFFKTYSLLNSEQELSRLSGYYSLLDNRIIDNTYLYERYELETSNAVKRTIIWVMGFSDDFESTLDIYEKVFSQSSRGIQNEIIGIIKREKEDYLNDFLKKIKTYKKNVHSN